MKRSYAGPDAFPTVLRQALENINEERSYQDERSFQGALLQELARRLESGSLPGDPIIEEEYQKRLRAHGIRIRPDIIVHVPFDRGIFERREQGNFVAIELKRRASAERAKDAFRNLAVMKKVLNYPLTIFINIDSEQSQSNLCPKSIAAQTVCFAVRLEGTKPVVKMERLAKARKKSPMTSRDLTADEIAWVKAYAAEVENLWREFGVAEIASRWQRFFWIGSRLR